MKWVHEINVEFHIQATSCFDLSVWIHYIFFSRLTLAFKPFNASCSQKGHAYLNKPAAESCMFVLVRLTFW